MAIAFKATTEDGSEMDGVLDWEDDYLVVEFERSRFFRPDEMVRVDIPLEDIDTVDFRQFIFNARLMVRTLYLDTAKQVDWSRGLDIKFVIPKREWGRALEMVDLINQAIDAEMEDE